MEKVTFLIISFIHICSIPLFTAGMQTSKIVTAGLLTRLDEQHTLLLDSYYQESGSSSKIDLCQESQTRIFEEYNDDLIMKRSYTIPKGSCLKISADQSYTFSERKLTN